MNILLILIFTLITTINIYAQPENTINENAFDMVLPAPHSAKRVHRSGDSYTHAMVLPLGDHTQHAAPPHTPERYAQPTRKRTHDERNAQAAPFGNALSPLRRSLSELTIADMATEAQENAATTSASIPDGMRTPVQPLRALSDFTELKTVSPNPKRAIRQSYTEEDRRKATLYAQKLDAIMNRAYGNLPSPLPQAIANEIDEFTKLFQYMREHLDLLNIMNNHRLTPINRLTLIRAVRNVLKVGKHYDRVESVYDRSQGKDRIVLQSDENIDPMKRDHKNRTNLERMKHGQAPLGPDGKAIQIHHLAQDDRYELVELTSAVHDGFLRFLHYKLCQNPQEAFLDYEEEHSERLPSIVHRPTFANFVKSYWRQRAKDFESKPRRNLMGSLNSLHSQPQTASASQASSATYASTSSNNNSQLSLDSFDSAHSLPSIVSDWSDDDDSSIVCDSGSDDDSSIVRGDRDVSMDTSPTQTPPSATPQFSLPTSFTSPLYKLLAVK